VYNTEYRKCVSGASRSEEDPNLENADPKEEGGDHPSVTEEDLVEMMDFADVRTLSTLAALAFGGCSSLFPNFFPIGENVTRPLQAI